MEEKKLTAEDIVKALECCSEHDNCFDCPIMGEMKRRNCICREVVLDLIHRLQSENDRLNDMKFTQEHCDLYKENEWLKAEIKRELADHKEFTKKANEEIERLTEEKEGWEKSCKLWSGANKSNHLKFSRTLEKLCEERNKNAELQKQVDELKEKQVVECYGMLKGCDIVKQAVKDTAKEIYELIDAVKEVFPNDYRGYDMAHGWSMCVDKLKEIIKSKGAEVE